MTIDEFSKIDKELPDWVKKIVPILNASSDFCAKPLGLVFLVTVCSEKRPMFDKGSVETVTFETSLVKTVPKMIQKYGPPSFEYALSTRKK